MRHLYALVAVVLVSGTAAAQTLLEFNVASATNNPTFLAPTNQALNVSASNLTAGPGLDPDSFWDGTNSLLLANNFTNAGTPDANDYSN